MPDDGTSFAIDLPVTGADKVDAASKSVDTLADRLDAVSKAVKASEVTYKTSEATATKAAKSLEKIGIAADAQRGKLQAALDAGDEKGLARAEKALINLAQRQGEVASKAAQAKAVLEQEASALDALRASEKKLGDEKTKADKSNAAGGKVLEGLSKIKGPIGDTAQKIEGLTEGWSKFTTLVGETGPIAAAAVGVAILAAAIVATTVAVVALVAKLGEWSIGLADVNRTNLLLAQGMTRTVAGGQELNDKINALTKKLPLTRDELAGLAKEFAFFGLRGKALDDQLEKTARYTARLKFGPDFERQLLSLDEQSKIFHANLAATFGGLKTDALMKALQTIVSLFDSDTESGKALKVVFESLFQPLVDGVANSGTKIERFFLQLEIWALEGLTAIKPYGSLIMKIGEGFAVLAALLVGTVAVAFAAVGAAVLAVVVTFSAAMYAVEQFVSSAIDGFGQVKAWFANVSFESIGEAMMTGLVNGILSGSKAVLAAITGTVSNAITAAKDLLGIHSPSKVFAEIGEQTGAGMKLGVQRSTSGVHDSLETMVSPSVSASTPSPDDARAAGAGGKSIDFSGAQFIFHGVKDAEDAESRFADVLTRIVEGDAGQLGALVPA